jgi:hypothetical protein
VDDPVIKKAYYSIGEVCELTGLKRRRTGLGIGSTDPRRWS